MTAAWYVVQTKPRQEETARINLERQGYTTFLPRLRRSRRGDARVEPFFPGYLFVRLRESKDDFAPIRSTVGVRKMVRFGLIYGRVPDTVIENLKTAGGGEGVVDAPRVELDSGTRVALVEGALSGYEGVVLGTHGKDRIRVLLDIAGTHSGVVAHRDDLTRL